MSSRQARDPIPLIDVRLENIKDIELELKISNNQLKQRRKALGLSRNKLSDMLNIPATSYGLLENMKINPKRKDGRWRDMVYRISDFYYADPEDLFPPITRNVKNNKAIKRIDESDALLLMGNCQALPDESAMASGSKQDISKALKTLTQREEAVIRYRYGLNEEKTEMTLEDIGELFGISKERIRGIESKALRKLRHPSRLALLTS